MPSFVLEAEHLSKRYLLSHRAAGGGLRHVLEERLTAPFRRLARRPPKAGVLPPETTRAASEEFWALSDVSFQVEEGEVVGIIGRNGAGKSTLLKLLSRITEPTRGRVRIAGRVASLLEVGTGFHPDLTGRENLFLNGAILGMSRREIQRKFDEIVAFAEVERFIDTPVKRYSSGMYLRLAFAVAAHLEPEILVVDEVLAVGDAAFQKKCLGKMGEVSRQQGRTILFVSHNLAAVESLCDSGMLLEKGRMIARGPVDQILPAYLKSFAAAPAEAPNIVFHAAPDAQKADAFEIREIALLDEKGEPKMVTRTWDHLRLAIRFHAPRAVANGSVVLEVSTFLGQKICQLSTEPLSGVKMAFHPGEGRVDCVIPSLPLAAGNYLVSAGLAVPKVEWLSWRENLGSIEVSGKDVFNSGCLPDQQRTPLVPPHQWEVLF